MAQAAATQSPPLLLPLPKYHRIYLVLREQLGEGRFDENDKPVQWLHGLYRPDRYEYTMELSRVGSIDAKVWVSKDLSARFT